MAHSLDICDRDLEHAVEISDRTYWVGEYRPGDSLQCHVYLIEQGDQSVLFDPGSNLTFETVQRKVREVTDFANIRYFVCHHQDPDITASLVQIDRDLGREDAVLVTHWRAEMLLQHYGCRRLVPWRVEEHDWALSAGSHRLKFVFTPYLHFPGAFCTFDEDTRVLFSSDLFGGLGDGQPLVAQGDSAFEAIRTFHEHYMPSRDILAHGLEKLGQLPIELIAPQHGSIIPGEMVADTMRRLAELECGIYLLAERDTDLRRLVEMNRALHDLTRTLVTYRDFGGMVRELVAIFKRVLPMSNLELFVRSEGKAALKFSEATGYRGVASEVPVSVAEVAATLPPGGHMSLPPGAGRGPTLIVPLETHGYGKATAVLHLTGSPPDQDALALVIRQMHAPLSIALEREWIQRQLEGERTELYERSIRDPLTHLFTRIHMIDVVGRLIALHNRDARAGFSLLMCDIDHFKRVNDGYGHLAGDQVLREVARVVRETTRSSDLAVRFGGEELAVFLAGTDDGTGAAERLRRGVEALQLDGELASLKVTISIGVGQHRQGESLEAMIERADTALYSAKNQGRNRVCVAS